ncbi:lipoprotein insertase outer membrane protein LolB [Kangiella sediminilitoris]|uniref:Outer-membrane lipoprotein LolB n=1 Tax=Kangiella sediminilitoris TaxID=1144748 RepID=A0A1B3BCP5_9GAMM|nr:lipoprotein insertase outer membrane protein LolB [Kangiella sediminilitoris]AOE50523.1 Outer-membrane lipoprotein LolB [Kangiella sediminilitoris]
MRLTTSKIILSALLSLLFLTACETTPVKQETTVWDDPKWQKHYKLLKKFEQFHLKGRIGITHPDDSFSSNFLWQQRQKDTFTFRMYGAFGTTYLILKVQPEYSTLDTGDDEHFEGLDAQNLLYGVSGWDIPVTLMQDWIKGLPTGINKSDLLINADGTLQQIKYLDYTVDYVRYDDAEWDLEGKVIPMRMPDKIRIVQGKNKIVLSIRSWDIEPDQD